MVEIAVTDGEAFLDACAALAVLSSPASDSPVARQYSLRKLQSSVAAHCLASQAAKVEGGRGKAAVAEKQHMPAAPVPCLLVGSSSSSRASVSLCSKRFSFMVPFLIMIRLEKLG